VRSAAAQQTAANANSSGDVSRNECQSPVTISGGVVAPGRFELRRSVRLNELLALAGGFTQRAKGSIEILHSTSMPPCKQDAPNGSGKLPPETSATYKIIDLLNGDEKANPYLRPGDSVTVFEMEPIYVVGSVMAPQGLLLRDGMTLTQALAMVGSVLKSARTEKISIFRQTGDHSSRRLYVNLKEIKKGRQQDILLQPYDIVDVPDKQDRYPGGHPGPPIYIKPKILIDEGKLPAPRIIH
jgi:protein involved in polysaccharide export with SLBB domain